MKYLIGKLKVENLITEIDAPDCGTFVVFKGLSKKKDGLWDHSI